VALGRCHAWIFEELFSTDLSLPMGLVIRHDGILVAIAALTLVSFHIRGSQEPSTQQACPPNAPGPSVPAAIRESLAPFPQGPQATIDDRWAVTAREIPGGFAGIILEGGPVVFLVDTTKRDAAVAALIARHALPGRHPERARVRKARWDFAQLHEWYEYLNGHLTGDSGFAMSDIDEGHNRLTYGVADSAARQRFEARLASLPVPCGLVVVEVTGFVEFKAEPSPKKR
jgi:hypothetical protein